MEEVPEDAQDALKVIIQNNEIFDYKTNVSFASNPGDGFLGKILRIEVIGSKNGQRITLNLVCKVPPSDFTNRKNMNVQISYEREVFVYNVILEHFKRFQLSKRIPASHMFTSYVKCYAAHAADNKAYLILEDLKAKSFKLFDKTKTLDRAHVQLFVENLAKFHAVSFATKDQQPDEYKKYTNLPEGMYEILGKKKTHGLCEFGLIQALGVLEKPEHKEKLIKIKETFKEVLHNCFNGIGSENYRIVTHGDCWNNNMMFKYQDEVPVEIYFLDWQISRYTSPVIDLSYYFYIGTEKEILSEHFDDLMDLYYAQLSKSIRLLGSNPELLYPYEVFQNDLKKFAKFGVIIGTFSLYFILAKSESAPDVGEIANIIDNEGSLENYLLFKDNESKNIYGKRIRDMVEHAVARNFI